MVLIFFESALAYSCLWLML